MNTDTLRLALFAGAALAGMLGIIGFAAIRRYERATGFSPGDNARCATVVGSDTGVARVMSVREPTLGLRGRPDYVFAEGAPNELRLTPIEVKPTRRSRRLYESDELQLGAYLVALRGTAGPHAASAGYVRYASNTFRVDLTPDLERRVRETVASVRRGRLAGVVHRSHSVPARCSACPVRQHCDERLK